MVGVKRFELSVQVIEYSSVMLRSPLKVNKVKKTSIFSTPERECVKISDAKETFQSERLRGWKSDTPDDKMQMDGGNLEEPRTSD